MLRVLCSALSVLASSSGVSSEREAFMELVKGEIGRLNSQLVSQDKGGVSLVFAAGGVQVCPRLPAAETSTAVGVRCEPLLMRQTTPQALGFALP